jgi:hypothetical protein
MSHSTPVGDVSPRQKEQAAVSSIPVGRSSPAPLWASALAEGIGTWTAQWVYLTAPFLGAVVGALVYRWMREAGKLSPFPTSQEDRHD